MTRLRRRLRSERGETLVEVMLTVVIAGVAVVALLAGLGTVINLSRVHRGQANTEIVLVNAADSVKSQAYVPCPSVTTSSYIPTQGVALPSGWSPSTVTITQVLGWNGTSFVACPSTDAKVQLVTIQVSPPSSGQSGVETVSVVKRDPA